MAHDSVAQLVASASGVALGGVAEVVGSNLARGKIFATFFGSVDSLYPSVYRLRAKKGPAPPPPREFCRHILS